MIRHNTTFNFYGEYWGMIIDHAKPFSPPDDVNETIPSEHQALDTGLDSHEWCDEGPGGATETTAKSPTGHAKYSDRYWNAQHGPVITVKPAIKKEGDEEVRVA